eukprot:m.198028 g.198028  ORF g.198028 m.198028 type:complete len:372 (+) comp18729_c0_seq4:131-1246(+)
MSLNSTHNVKQHIFAMRTLAAICISALLAGLDRSAEVAAATTNVTYAPWRSIPNDVVKRTEKLGDIWGNSSQNEAARGQIRDLIERLDVDTASKYARHLSGEAPESLQNSRVSTNTGPLHPFGIDFAIDYVQREMQGFGFQVELTEYDVDFAPNIVSCLRGVEHPDEIVVLGAHLDDIPSTGRAPGANDDGSGSSALLASAAAIHASGAKFKRTLCIEHYTGEEQGLVGSRAQAKLRASRRDDVVAMIQQDMTALHLDGDAMGMAFVQDGRAVDETLTDQVEGIAREYADPELQQHRAVLSGSSCCSDHQSYFEAGFPSVGIIEPRGYTGDPQYHKATDVVDRPDYDTTQLALTARVALAAAASFAEIVFQ